MKRFANLVTLLDQTTKTNSKLQALVDYLDSAPSEDKVWAVALLGGKRPRRTVNTTLLAQWAAKDARIPEWLFGESYHIVGDLAETISLILPQGGNTSSMSLSGAMDRLAALGSVDDLKKEKSIRSMWTKMASAERFVMAKLITGGFRLRRPIRL